MSSILELLGRNDYLFEKDIRENSNFLDSAVANNSFLVIGGAGSIGQAVTKEIFKRNPSRLHVVDISENNLVELVRDIRSSFGYIEGDFQTFSLDIGSIEFDAFIESGEPYDYMLNLSALKHVRSESNPYTLMRMTEVNILNTDKTVKQAAAMGAKKYFCVSTDKAANPVNMMGASKRIMEMFLMRRSKDIPVSTARFANVAFSDGSLLHGFNQRLLKGQPIAVPGDVKRYFVTPEESGELCLVSCIFGENRDIYFPRLSEHLRLTTFTEIAEKYLRAKGFEPHLCEDEEEARRLANSLPGKGKWPCLYTTSDTTGEKDFEEFYTEKEILDLEKFSGIGIIKNDGYFDAALLDHFTESIGSMRSSGHWDKQQFVALFKEMLPGFQHKETGKYLDGKM